MLNKILIYILILLTPSLGLSIMSRFERVILVTGQSGSGKTAITQVLRDYLSRFRRVATLSLDSFYHDGALSVTARNKPELLKTNTSETVQTTIDFFLTELNDLGFPGVRLKYLPQYDGDPSWELPTSYNWDLLKLFFEFMESNSKFHYPPYYYGKINNFKNIPEPIVPADILFVEGLHTASPQMLETLASLDLITEKGKKPSILLLNVMTDLEISHRRATERDLTQNRDSIFDLEPMDPQLFRMITVLKEHQMKVLSEYLAHLSSHISYYLEENSPLKLQLLNFNNNKYYKVFDETQLKQPDFNLPPSLESAINNWMTKEFI